MKKKKKKSTEKHTFCGLSLILFSFQHDGGLKVKGHGRVYQIYSLCVCARTGLSIIWTKKGNMKIMPTQAFQFNPLRRSTRCQCGQCLAPFRPASAATDTDGPCDRWTVALPLDSSYTWPHWEWCDDRSDDPDRQHSGVASAVVYSKKTSKITSS